MKDAENAVQILNDLLAGSRLKPSVDQHLTDMRSGRTKSFYTDILEKKGREVADQALEKWAGRDHMREFANSIEQIALGMRDIAKMDLEDNHVRVISVTRDLIFPLARSFGYGATLIAVLNLPRHEGCGCNQPDGAEIFGEHGTLPIKSVVLGVSSSTSECKLALVFPARETTSLCYGYTTITIARDGWVNGENCFPHINKYDHLRYSLGLIQAKQAFTALTTQGGSVDDRIGFPGAGAYLALHLPKIGPYLSLISKTIGKNHQ